MYNTLFSDQWLFDRCVEASAFQFHLILLFSAPILFVLFRYFKKNSISHFKASLIFLSSAIVTFLLMWFVSFISGYLIFSCSAGDFWKGVDPAIELNTNGYLWSQIYTVMGGDPFEILLRSIKKHAAFITVGSDAHKPEFVGKSFRELAHLLRIMGIDEYATFEKGRRKVHPVP